ncbi:pleckstriny-like domain family B member 3 [Grus japonensis]|uniref:Pleckstriny-like domain family B member 3 n=1 Tax=Grus japonensis TaxID=30415 RepID=A0ABC9XS00_GRUJA
MVHRDPPPPPGAGEESNGPPPPPDPTAVALKLQGLNLQDERPPAEEDGDERPGGEHLEDPEMEKTAVTSSGTAMTSSGVSVPSPGTSMASETMTSEAAVTSEGQLMFSHRTDRRLILLGPRQRDPPCVLALRSSIHGAIGLQRASSLPRRRGERGVSPPTPRPRSHHGQGVLALQLDPESYSACLHLAELERRVREALAERERLLRAREARRAPPPPTLAPPPPTLAPPPPELDLARALRARGHRPEGCGDVRVSGGSCRGPLTKRGRRIKTWRRRWFHLDPRRGVWAYYGDKEETKLKGVIYFQAIEEVYYDPGRAACKSPNPRLTFCVKTYDRLFCLVAPSAEALRIWMDAVLTVTQGDAPP